MEIFTVGSTSIATTGLHLFWSDKPDESLKDSLMEIGQTTPVLVCEGENGLELVAGHARLTLLTETGNPILARMVEDATPVDKGLLYLADNMQRPVDDGMRLKALAYFAPLMDAKALSRDILPRLGVKPKSKDAKLLAAWLDQPKQWQDLLISGNVPLAAATPLGRMDAAEQETVFPLFENYSWSRSNAVNLLNWLFETARMTASSVKDVIEQAGMNAIMSQGLSPKDTIARLSAAARTARYPELTKLQTSFAEAAGEIVAGTRWRMVQPNNFETGGSELTIQVKDATQLRRAVEDLQTMEKSPAWEKIWKLGSSNE